MNRIVSARLGRLAVLTSPLILLATVLGVASASSAAVPKFWPSITLNHQVGLKNGQVLKVTGKGFPPNVTVTLYQCNVGLLNAPRGVINASTCDLKNTPTTKTSSTGTISATFKVKNEQINGQAADYVNSHRKGLFSESWGHASIEFSNAAFVSTSPTEPWLNPQTVKVTGLKIPAVPPASMDFAAECNANVLSGDVNACGSPSPLTVNSKGTAKGSLSMVTGTVGDGTCGTGSADEVCYVVLVNVPNGGGTVTPIAIEAVDFYEGQ